RGRGRANGSTPPARGRAEGDCAEARTCPKWADRCGSNERNQRKDECWSLASANPATVDLRLCGGRYTGPRERPYLQGHAERKCVARTHVPDAVQAIKVRKVRCDS